MKPWLWHRVKPGMIPRHRHSGIGGCVIIKFEQSCRTWSSLKNRIVDRHPVHEMQTPVAYRPLREDCLTGKVSGNDRKGIGALRHYRDGWLVGAASPVSQIKCIRHIAHRFDVGLAGGFKILGFGTHPQNHSIPSSQNQNFQKIKKTIDMWNGNLYILHSMSYIAFFFSLSFIDLG